MCSPPLRVGAFIPLHTISRERAQPGLPGWARFRGQLSQASRHHLLNIVGALFAYLKLANHLTQNPWALIKTRASMKKTAVNSVDTRAFTSDAQAEIERLIAAQPPSPTRARMLFIVGFVSGVGLRAAELLTAKLSDLRFSSGGYVLQVMAREASRALWPFRQRPCKHSRSIFTGVVSVVWLRHLVMRPCWPAPRTRWRRSATRRSI